jgi:hypothetical protein
MANEIIRTFTVGDQLRSPRALLRNPDGSPLDLTGNGVAFRLIRIADGYPQIPGTTDGVSIVNSTGGEVRKDFISTSEVPVGEYFAWFIRYLTTSTGAYEHFPAGRSYKIRILADT